MIQSLVAINIHLSIKMSLQNIPTFRMCALQQSNVKTEFIVLTTVPLLQYAAIDNYDVSCRVCEL